MPAYNHTREGVVEQTRDHIRLNQEGDFHCYLCGVQNFARSSLEVQRHFEERHDFEFGKLIWSWLSPHSASYPSDHVAAEGIE